MTQTDQQNVPKLRFPGFEGAWQHLAVHEIIRGHRLGGNYENSESPTDKPLIKMGNLRRGSMDVSKLDFIPIGVAVDPKDKVSKGDLFFNTRNTLDLVGKVAIWRDELPTAYYNSNLLKIDFDDTEFMNYRFNDFKGLKALKRIASGTTSVAAIYTKDFLKVKLPLPTLPEQRKIASFLGAVDTKIAQLAEKKRLLEDYKKGCMQQLFSQKIRFKDDTGNDFPDWEEKRLGELGETFGGLTGKSADDFGTGARFVTYLQVFNASEIYPDQCGFVEIKPGERQNKVQRGDIIFTTSSETSSEVGFASVVTTDLHDTYLNSFCFGLRPRSIEELFPTFSRYLFRSADYRKKVIPLAQGSTRYNLSKTSFLKIRIHIPHPAEQRKIADFLSAIDRKIDLVGQELTHARAFKQGLLQQMFV